MYIIITFLIKILLIPRWLGKASSWVWVALQTDACLKSQGGALAGSLGGDNSSYDCSLLLFSYRLWSLLPGCTPLRQGEGPTCVFHPLPTTIKHGLNQAYGRRTRTNNMPTISFAEATNFSAARNFCIHDLQQWWGSSSGLTGSCSSELNLTGRFVLRQWEQIATVQLQNLQTIDLFEAISNIFLPHCFELPHGCACAVIPCNFVLFIFCIFSLKIFGFTVHFTEEECKNYAHACATCSRPPLFFLEACGGG